MSTKRQYLDRDVFHQEMTKCKRNNDLSPAAIEMLYTLSNEVSRKYYFEHAEDYEDAACNAVFDCYKYWRGFKENYVIQLKILRNFNPGEQLQICVDGCQPRVFEAGSENNKNSSGNIMFAIGDNINKTLANLKDMCGDSDVAVFLDRVKSKVTFMDNRNIDPGDTYSSTITFIPNLKGETLLMDAAGKFLLDIVGSGSTAIKTKRKGIDFLPISDAKFHTPNFYKFKKPPNSFSYFTSVVNNGILKFIDQRNPKALRNGNLLPLSGNGNSVNFFNI
jgi:hypothetical protein